jgi:hypothetical protein
MADAVIRTQERALVMGQQFDPIISLVLDGLTSEHSRRAYERALTDFLTWWSAQGKLPMSKTIVERHRRELREADLAPSTINQRLSAIRKLAQEASDVERSGTCDAAAVTCGERVSVCYW